jgi:hypothetical protein
MTDASEYTHFQILSVPQLNSLAPSLTTATYLSNQSHFATVLDGLSAQSHCRIVTFSSSEQ